MIFTPLDMMVAWQRNYMQMLAQMSQGVQDMVPMGQAWSGTKAGESTGRELQVREADGEQVIRFGEERLNVSTRKVHGAATRVRRVVHSVPVERRVELNDETIVVERRPTDGAVADGEAMFEREYVMFDTREIPVVRKETHVRETLVVRREKTGRVEIIKDVLRRSEPDVVRPNRVPVVIAAYGPKGNGAAQNDSDEQLATVSD